MVLSYLRWEADAAATFGLVSTSTCNVLFQKQAGLALSGGGESILLWNIKQGVILATLTPDGIGFTGVGATKRPQLQVLAAHPVDASMIAAGYSDGTLRIWSLTSKKSLVTLHGHRSGVTALVFSADGSRLYSGALDTDIIGWDVVSEQGLFRLKGHKGPITALALLEAVPHHHLLSASKDTLVKVWDLDTQHCVQTLVGHRAEVTAMTVNARETQLVTGAAEGPLRIWNILATGEKDITAIKKAKDVTVKVEPGTNASTATTTTSSSSATSSSSLFTSAAASIELITFWGFLPRESTKRVCELSFWPVRSADPLLLLCQASDRILELYGVRTKEEVDKKVKRRMKRQREKQKKHAEKEKDDTSMTDVNDPNAAATAAASQALSTQPIPIDQFQALLPIRTSVKIVSFSASSSSVHLRLLLGLHDNSLQVWNIDLQGARATMEEEESKPALPVGSSPTTLSPHYTQLYSITNAGHRTGIRVVSLNSDSTSLMTASGEQIKIWNVHSKQCIRTIDSGYALCGFFVPGSRHVLIGTKTGEIELYDLSTGSCLQKIAAHSNESGVGAPVYSMDLRPDQKGFISGGGDKEVKVWDFELVLMKMDEESPPIRSLQIVHTKTLKLTDDILCVRNSPDGKLLAVGLLDATIKIFYADSLKFFLSLYGHKLPVLSLDISSDSNLLLSGGADKNIKLWGLDFGDCHKSMFGHMDSVTAVRFIPRTHLFFTTGKDKIVKLWDGDTFEQVQVLEGHTQEIWGLAVNHTGTTIVTAGNDKSIRIYRQTDQQLFLEEERETSLEALYDEGATTEQKAMGEMTGSGLVLASESALVARTKANQESLKAGERLMEALDMADAERDRWQRYDEAVLAQKEAKANLKNGKLTGLQLIAAEMEQTEKAAPVPVPQPNPLIKGDADNHVLSTLLSIPTPELDESLLILPFDYAVRFLTYLNRNIAAGISVEPCVHTLLFLLANHHKQFIANQTLLDTLRESRQHVRQQLTGMKSKIGFNIAAIKFLERQAKELQGQHYFGEKETNKESTEPELHVHKKRKF